MIDILLIEHNDEDVVIIETALSRSAVKKKQFNLERVHNLQEGFERISREHKAIDIILLDLDLPGSSGLDTLNLLYEQTKSIPAVVLTKQEDERLAEEAIKMGAQDYLLKEHIIPDTLRRIIVYAIERAKILNEKKKLIQQLWKANENIKVLKGLLPICSKCKKIRNDGGYWQQIEEYVQEHSEADFSHSICPVCLKELYPWFVDADEKQKLQEHNQ